MKHYLFIFAFSLLVLPAHAEELKTIDWYKQNRTELVLKLIECKNNPDHMTTSPSCTHAQDAAEELTRQTYRSLSLVNYAQGTLIEMIVLQGIEDDFENWKQGSDVKDMEIPPPTKRQPQNG